MAVFAFTNAKVLVNAVDLSDHVKKITLNVKFAELDSTTMGATYQTRIGGLGDFSVTIDWAQDFATSKIDQTFFPLLGTVVALSVNPVNAANSATNPNYSGSILIADYSPVDGAVGDFAQTSVTWPGSGALTRAIV